jgi:hypothetical protein
VVKIKNTERIEEKKDTFLIYGISLSIIFYWFWMILNI